MLKRGQVPACRGDRPEIIHAVYETQPWCICSFQTFPLGFSPELFCTIDLLEPQILFGITSRCKSPSFFLCYSSSPLLLCFQHNQWHLGICCVMGLMRSSSNFSQMPAFSSYSISYIGYTARPPPTSPKKPIWSVPFCDLTVCVHSLINPNTLQSNFCSVPNKTFLCPHGEAAVLTALPVCQVYSGEAILVLILLSTA